MTKKIKKDSAAKKILKLLLAKDSGPFPFSGNEELSELYGESEPFPGEWVEPVVKACLDTSRPYAQRADLMGLLSRLPSEKVAETVRKLFRFDMLDSEYIHDAVQEGDTSCLNNLLDRRLPGYRSVPAVVEVVQQILASEIGQERRAEAHFLGVDGGAIDWLDSPENVPGVYNISNTCATCSSFYPQVINDEGVLGHCGLHSAELGLFAHRATCDDWSKRD